MFFRPIFLYSFESEPITIITWGNRRFVMVTPICNVITSDNMCDDCIQQIWVGAYSIRSTHILYFIMYTDQTK